MPKLVFSRHGLSEWNALNQFTGWADVNLAPEGIEEAKEGGRKIKEAGIEAEKVNKLSEGRPNILDLITNGNIDIIVNSPVGKDSVNDDSYLRKGAIKAKIPYYTTIAAAKAAAEGIAYVKAHQDQNEEVNSLQGLHAQISDK